MPKNHLNWQVSNAPHAVHAEQKPCVHKPALSCAKQARQNQSGGKGKKKPLNQNANNLYINTLKILLLKRTGSRRKPLLFKTGSVSKCFLKIIREVQTTKGTLLLANWKLARASEVMTDFHPVVGQHTSHVSPRYGLLPTDTASASPTASRLQWALSAVTRSNSARVFHHTVPDRLAPLLLCQQPRDVQEMDFFGHGW